MIVADACWIIALRDPDHVHHRDAIAAASSTRTEVALLHPVTLAECLVAPARLGVLHEAATALRNAFDIPDIDPEAPLRWAQLRSATRLRLPDAIVLDTALSHRASAIVTFDATLAGTAEQMGVDTIGLESP